MKLFIFIIAIILNINRCSDSSINQEAITIEYSATSRGYYNKIVVNNKEITTLKDRNGNPKVTPCSEKKWNAIYSILKTVDIKNITNLKAPSDKRFHDGAAIANLTITYQDSVYESQPFDHGNPPQEINKLVKEILSLTQNIE